MSVLTSSVNEIICHGIPDRRALKDGDIINIDVTLFHQGAFSLLTQVTTAICACNADLQRDVHCWRAC